MANLKNQHFVPRCVLKPFTLESRGCAINLVNIASEKAIEAAPVKNQCSRDYFYGRDLRLEKFLGQLEGQYSRIAKALSSCEQISAEDEKLLRLFIIIQTRRTERAVLQMKSLYEEITKKIYEFHNEQRPEEPDWLWFINSSIRLAVELHGYIADLKFVVIRNCTNVDFLISDHPAIVTNRFCLEKLRDRQFGICNAGLIVAFPISPRITAILFDIGVYTISIPRGTKYIDVRNQTDVRTLNEWQILEANHNIYFSRWRDNLAFMFETNRIAKARLDLTPRVQRFVRDPQISGEAYRIASSPKEAASAKEHLIVSGFDHAEPSAWPSFLKYRRDMNSVDTKSGAGILRPAAAAKRYSELSKNSAV